MKHIVGAPAFYIGTASALPDDMLGVAFGDSIDNRYLARVARRQVLALPDDGSGETKVGIPARIIDNPIGDHFTVALNLGAGSCIVQDGRPSAHHPTTTGRICILARREHIHEGLLVARMPAMPS